MEGNLVKRVCTKGQQAIFASRRNPFVSSELGERHSILLMGGGVKEDFFKYKQIFSVVVSRCAEQDYLAFTAKTQKKRLCAVIHLSIFCPIFLTRGYFVEKSLLYMRHFAFFGFCRKQRKY